MFVIRRIRVGEGELFKRMRLTALYESASAFSSTYESALSRSDESWSEQADSTATGSDRATFFAFSGEAPVGIAALYRDKARTDVGEVLQVWVASDHRGKGIAFDLMDAVFEWAAHNGFREVIAIVKKGNIRALTFYRKYGFDPVDGVSPANLDDYVLRKEVAGKRTQAPDAQPRQ